MRSRVALVFIAIGALAIAVSGLAIGIAYATLSSDQETGTFRDLIIAGEWMKAAGVVLVFVALGVVAWKLILRSPGADFWEVTAATASTLLYAIGGLIGAAQAMASPESANILAAIGIGGWAIVLAARAGRCAFSQHAIPTTPRTAGLWLAASITALLLAISAGLPSASLTDQGLELTITILYLVGVVTLIGTLTVARSREFVSWSQKQFMVGLWFLAAAAACGVVVAAVVFGPSRSLTSIRIAIPTLGALEVLAYFLLALAAWGRAMTLPSSPVLSGLSKPDATS
ncbi:MAG: hypothetical protein ACYCPT_09435 [Acidimicrobiales bacterium]